MIIGRYDWSGGSEAMLRFGPQTGPVVIAALPLFEEANRTRAFTVSVLRALADRGVGSVLPDLPATGESLVTTDSLSMTALRTAYAGVAEQFGGRRVYGVAIRSGALIDHDAPLHGRWHMAPQSGVDVIRDLRRVSIAGSNDPQARLDTHPDGHVRIAGNAIPTEFLAELERCEPFDDPALPRRVVRLTTDPKPADARLDGVALWRRAEPDTDLALSQRVARDIIGWIETCGG